MMLNQNAPEGMESDVRLYAVRTLTYRRAARARMAANLLQLRTGFNTIARGAGWWSILRYYRDSVAMNEARRLVCDNCRVRAPRNSNPRCVGSFHNDEGWTVDPRVLLKSARSMSRYARTRFGPIILDDGYALCGEEDARAERQEWAGIDARAYRWLARRLLAGSL